MELHRQNQSRRLRNERRTQNAVPVGGAVARRCLHGIGRLSSWHVVAIDLHSVDVTDDAHAVKEHESDSSHACNSREVLAEVYGLDWREGGSDDGRRPGFIVEGEVFSSWLAIMNALSTTASLISEREIQEESDQISLESLRVSV